MPKENFCFFISYFKAKIRLYFRWSIISLLNNSRNFIKLIENSTLIYFFLFHKYSLHKANKFKDIACNRINSSNIISNQHFLQARQQRQLILILNIQKIEEIVLLLWSWHLIVSLHHQLTILCNNIRYFAWRLLLHLVTYWGFKLLDTSTCPCLTRRR